MPAHFMEAHLFWQPVPKRCLDGEECASIDELLRNAAVKAEAAFWDWKKYFNCGVFIVSQNQTVDKPI